MLKKLFMIMAGMVLIAGVAYAASANLPKTGQTKNHAAGDDGELKKGAAWPSPRFTVGRTGDCVTDNLTGLMWTKNANLPKGKMKWQAALDYANKLTLCGYDDWRLPNINELESLVDAERTNPALPSGNPFSNVQAVYYWSSSTFANYPTVAWFVGMDDGFVFGFYKTATSYVWPVRAGQ